MAFDLTWDEVKNLPEGATCGMACTNCEGHEVHKKQDDKWVCQWCGCKEINA